MSKHIFFSAAVIGVVVLIVSATGLVVGIYQYGWEGKWTLQILNFVPLPAALVNGKLIPLREVYERLAWYQNFPDPEAGAPQINLKKQILYGLIEERIVSDLAQRTHHAEATDPELDRYYRYLLKKFAVSPEGAAEELRRRFGMTEAQFKREIVLPDLRKAKLRLSLLKDATSSASSRQANFVHEELVSGLDFAEAALEYSEDETSKFLGGDLGILREEELNPWLAAAAFSLTAGEISNVVADPDGYHILQVTAIDEHADPVVIQLRHILIRNPSIEAYLETERTKYRVLVFEKL